MLPPLLILVLSLLGLIISARFAIRALTNITEAFGVSEFTVAFVILALATSLPEVSVAITSALQNAGAIVLSTAFGSNIINITLVMGLTSILSGGVSTEGLHIRRDIFLAGIIAALPLLFLLNGTISRFEGVLLIISFLVYLGAIAHDQLRYGNIRIPHNLLWGGFSIVGALAMIGVLLYSADLVVTSSVQLAAAIGIPTFLIGLFLLAAGTSLPELVTTLHSSRNGQSKMALGNIIGSNVTNSSLVIGIATVIQPIHTSLHPSLIVTMIFVALATLMLGYFAASRNSLSVFDGFKLVGSFFMFGIVLFATGAVSI